MMRAWASIAAIGMPTMPGPTTAILWTLQEVTLSLSSVSGIGLVGGSVGVHELPVPQLEVEQTPQAAAKRLFMPKQLLDMCGVEDATLPAAP